MFQNSFLSALSLRDRWYMEGHVVGKWQTIVRCLMWSSCSTNNGYRTCNVFFVPVPNPRSTDPMDPCWYT
jgi:hypothetical protein